MRLLWRACVLLLFVFLLAPLLLVIPLSFSAANNMAWPPPGWSTRWYAAIPEQDGLIQAALNSLALGGLVVTCCLVLGIPAALALDRGRFPGREALMALITAPLLLPTIVIGIALLMMFVRMGLLGSWTGLVLGHLTITLPYAVRVLSTALSTLPPGIEDAARSLGASPFRVFRRVTLPMMVPGVVATAAITFLVSFDEVVISLFVVGPQLTTLPVALFRYVESRTDPLVAAVSTLLVALTMLVVFVLDRAVGLRRAVGSG